MGQSRIQILVPCQGPTVDLLIILAECQTISHIPSMMFSVQGLVEYLLRFMKYKRNCAKPKEKLQCDEQHKNKQKVMEQAKDYD